MTIGKMKSTAKNMTKPLLPMANNPLVSVVASALDMSERTANGAATKMPNNGVNKVQKAQRFHTHQYQTVVVGFISRHNAHNSLWVQGARGVLAAWTKAQTQKNANALKDMASRT